MRQSEHHFTNFPHIGISIKSAKKLSTQPFSLLKSLNAVTLRYTTSRNELYCVLALSADWLDIFLALPNLGNNVEK